VLAEPTIIAATEYNRMQAVSAKGGGKMSEKVMLEALDAIHNEAIKLLQHDLSKEIREGLDLIVSIARYKQDIRTNEEKQSY
jgi:hypothetical protein